MSFSVHLSLLAYGGVQEATHHCLTRDLPPLMNAFKLYLDTNYGDACVARVRGRAATNFLRSGHEVMIMIDHDLTWQPGAIEHLARAAYASRSIVGGAVSLKAMGSGIASRFCTPGTYEIGTDQLVPATYVGAAFMAFHRDVLVKMVNSGQIHLLHDNWWTFFLQEVRRHPEHRAAYEYLSEDWAFCARALDLGLPVYVDLFPVIGHLGQYQYTVVTSQLQDPQQEHVEKQQRARLEVVSERKAAAPPVSPIEVPAHPMVGRAGNGYREAA
jgi:hypothetical protein